MMMVGTAAIIPAAGLGLRLGGDTTKVFREVGGESVLVHAVRGLCSAPVDLSFLVVVARAGDESLVSELLQPVVGRTELTVVTGGAERTDSVRRGLRVVPPGPFDCLLVHDAARPFVPAAVIARVVEAVRSGADAVIPVVPVTDTIKQIGPDGQVTGTPDRSALVAVQTPQGFRPEVLRRAYDAVPEHESATDDAALVERLGLPVDTVEGSPDSFKITRPHDLLFAESMLARSRA